MESIEKFVDQAHEIFSGTSVFEIIDEPRETAVVFLNKVYQNPPQETVDRYLDVVQQLRDLTTNKLLPV